MRRLLIVLAVITAMSSLTAWADPIKSEGNKSSKTLQDEKTQEDPDVCYPEALTEQQKKIGMGIPCEKKNYIYMPLNNTQPNATHDSDGIWSDQEVKDSTIDAANGASIWEKTAKIGATEVTISMIATGLCFTPSVCPFRVRLRTSGKPDSVKGWPKTDQACASGLYYFIRDDFKELVACDEHIALD